MSYNHFTGDVMRALNLTRLPVEGIEPRTVLGVRVWIVPLPTRPESERRWKRSNHRLMCACPLCAWTGSVGRLGQHKCSHAETHCWGCGDRLDRVTDKPARYGQHSFCSWHCVYHTRGADDYEPVDYDQADRNAVASERIENMRNER